MQDFILQLTALIEKIKNISSKTADVIEEKTDQFPQKTKILEVEIF